MSKYIKSPSPKVGSCRVDSIGCGSRDVRKIRTLEGIVSHYRSHHQAAHEQDLDFYRHQDSLRGAILNGASALDDEGKIHPHQRRIGRARLRRWAEVVLASRKAIGKCTTFEELLALIRRLARDEAGIGSLCTYDTSLRIGAYLGLSPTVVNLHAGTMKGALALGLDVSRGYLESGDFPVALQRLTAMELEDVLCIYKDRFQRMHA